MISNVFAIKINEVELNPIGTDAGNEWIEFYSEGEISLEGYRIVNNDGKNISLNGSFSGYYVYVFDKQWLDNSDEKIFLYKDSELIDETKIFEDSKNDNFAWQLCKDWEFVNSTKGEKNFCEEEKHNEDENSSIEKEEINEEPQEEIKEENNNTEKLAEKLDKENTVSSVAEEIEQKDIELEVIKLNAKSIKSENNKENSEKSNYAMYGFVIFCVLLGLLFIFRRNRFNKNEFR